jgi:hypothetical protein
MQVQSHTAVVEEPPTGISTSTKELRSIPDLCGASFNAALLILFLFQIIIK